MEVLLRRKFTTNLFSFFFQVIKLANLADPLADCSIGFASKLPGGSQKQTELLDKAKTVCESAAALVYATKDSGGNPQVLFHKNNFPEELS